MHSTKTSHPPQSRVHTPHTSQHTGFVGSWVYLCSGVPFNSLRTEEEQRFACIQQIGQVNPTNACRLTMPNSL